MKESYPLDDATRALLAALKAFCFPGGEDAARRVRRVKTTQRGEMCSAPGARWIPFTADEWTDATQSSFRWEARYGSGLRSVMITDAYEEGRGRLVVKLGGLISVKKFSGPDFDQGEIQRYFSSILMCPAILLNHPTLEFSTAGGLLRVRDRNDSTGATVDFEIDETGRPLACKAQRPRLATKNPIPTPWSGICTEFQEWQGMRVARRIEATWHLAEGTFAYYRSEITSYTACP